MKDRLLYSFLRILTFPLSLLSFRQIHQLGKRLGLLAFHLLPTYRKRALSNLALAKNLRLTPSQQVTIAKQSFQTLATTLLEYTRLSSDRYLSQHVHCDNPEIAQALYQKGQGIIFFCGHQSNWEVLFLDGTRKMKGMAIGKPTKNKWLYQWILSIREKQGGKIVPPREALREGARALRQGIFLGIVGDQGMPESRYSFPFFGRTAWNSTAPALLAYKTHSPIIVATTRCTETGYHIHYSDPIWPNEKEPLEREVVRLMDHSLSLLEETIRKRPEEWLWLHNRWKQQTPKNILRPFRQDSLCLILPQEEELFLSLLPHLPFLKTLYPKELLFVFVPQKYRSSISLVAEEIIPYSDPSQLLKKDFRFKLVFNFTSYTNLCSHYKRYSALEVLTLKDLARLAQQQAPQQKPQTLSELLLLALCRPGAFAHAKG